MKVQGKVFKYGNNVDTDVIIPARYLNVSDGNELSKYCMIDLDPEFIKNVNNGDVIVAGNNFGCGSSREHAPLAIKCGGVSCVIASTFARIFYRNAINIGMPILECDEAVKDINNKDIIEIDFDTGIISNKTKNKAYQAQPFPEFIKEIINSNGLVNMTKNKIQGENHE
jgi:3-isopropylmalate/(R)-2-methylmalate dehydratase small subunit